MNIVFALLASQIVLGGFDSLWHHEIQERLPSRRGARHELALHAAREFIYAGLFACLAWYSAHGAWAWVIAAALLIEVVITLADFLVEDRTRKLPALERVLHTVLAINFGAMLTAFFPVWRHWLQQPTALVDAGYGAWSWMLSAAALGVGLWGIRNIVAALQFARPPRWLRDPIKAGAAPQARTLLITGATGFVGRHFCRERIQAGDRLIVLSRDYDRAWDLYGPHARIVTSLDEIDASCHIDIMVNLAGAPILGLWWTQKRRQVLLDSRLRTTTALVGLIARLQRKPQLLLSMSAIGYYGVRGDEEITEANRGQPIFQSHLCQLWELAAQRALQYGVRVCCLRAGLILGADGGALPQLSRPSRFGVRTVLGSGAQWVSWIHITDLLRLMSFCIERQDVRGSLNATAPQPLRQRDFARNIGTALGRTIELRAPRRALRLALGEMSQLLLDGQRVLPARALCAGFDFIHPTVAPALQSLLRPAVRTDALQPAEIFYDPNCPVCDLEMSCYRRCAQRAGLKWRFENVALKAAVMHQYGISVRDARRRVYVLNTEGRMQSGIEAIGHIWRGLPGWRWLGKLVQLPAMNAVCAVIYDLVIAPLIWRWSMHRSMRSGLAVDR